MVSEVTKKLVEYMFPDEFIFLFNKEVNVIQAKRDILTYFVEKNNE